MSCSACSRVQAYGCPFSRWALDSSHHWYWSVSTRSMSVILSEMGSSLIGHGGCRRIANRESARRVRQKRQDVMEELQMKVSCHSCRTRSFLCLHKDKTLRSRILHLWICRLWCRHGVLEWLVFWASMLWDALNELARYLACLSSIWCGAQINALQSQNQRLMARVGEVEAHKGMLTGQVAALRNKWSSATNDNVRLQAELGTLRKTLQVGVQPGCFAHLALRHMCPCRKSSCVSCNPAPAGCLHQQEDAQLCCVSIASVGIERAAEAL